MCIFITFLTFFNFIFGCIISHFTVARITDLFYLQLLSLDFHHLPCIQHS